MRTTVVTSFSEKGFHQYGKRFIAQFEEFWPKEVSLMIYYEGVHHEEFCRHTSVNLLDVPACKKWVQEHQDNDLCKGLVPNKPHLWKQKDVLLGYNYKFDAFKFARKVFVLADAATLITTGKMFWVDADVLTFKHLPLELFEVVLPATAHISYLERVNTHSECGFMGFNLNSYLTLDFLRYFVWVYTSGVVFKCQEWHDSYVFDYVVKVKRRRRTFKAHVIHQTKGGHVFIQSILGEYMDHLKGARKDTGSSTPVDIESAHVGVYYWDSLREESV